MKKNLLIAFAACVAFAACNSDKDYYNPDAIGEIKKATYEANFAEKFKGTNWENQSWTFGNWQTLSFTGSVTNNLAKQNFFTRAADYELVETDYLEIDKAAINEFFSVVPEGKDNRANGKAFVMTVPNNEFTIVPQYMNAGYTWDLYMVVATEDAQGKTVEKEIKLWSRGKNIQYGYNNKWYSLGATTNTTNTRYSYRAKGYTFKPGPDLVGKKMYFFLHVTASGSDYGKRTYSIDGHMLSLQTNLRPSCVPEGCEFTIIGCEDTNMNTGGDKDLNDLVFLVYGKPFIPQEEEVKPGEPIIRTESRRYLIEDLGAVDDFDFNDVVVDVKRTRTETPKANQYGVIVDWEYGPWQETATLKHLGGEIPFVLKIGETTWNEIMPPVPVKQGTDTIIRYVIKGWDPTQNNIECTIRGKVNDRTETWGVKFPKKGEVPMIIATDTTRAWNAERVIIDPSLWYETEPNN